MKQRYGRQMMQMEADQLLKGAPVTSMARTFPCFEISLSLPSRLSSGFEYGFLLSGISVFCVSVASWRFSGCSSLLIWRVSA